MSNDMPLKGLMKGKIKNLTSVAYDTIKSSIFSNEIKPGDYLSENQIAQTLGMSRTPIREAIKVLASEGLVEIHNGVGIFVKQITAKEIHDLFEVRAALECAAVLTALDNITRKEIESIEKEWLEYKRKIEEDIEIDIDAISDLDYNLHFLIVERCKNDYLKSIVNGIRMKIMRYQRISARALANVRETINQHLEIMEYMKKKDVEMLLKVLKEHIEKAEENISRNPNWTL